MSDICIVCEVKIGANDSATVGVKGLNSLIESSKARGDELHLRWKDINVPVKVHIKCRKDYTRQTSIQKDKRKIENTDDSTQENPTKLRSRLSEFRIKEDCLYCCKPVIYDKNNLKKTAYSSVETLEYLENVLKKADERSDEWASDVKLRIQLSSDLVAAEGKYHRYCAQRFYAGSQLLHDIPSSAGRPPDKEKTKPFETLCQYLRENDECQYSMNELFDLYQGYCGAEGGYTVKWLQQKLAEYFGEDIVVTHVRGKPNVISFRDHSHKIIRDVWEKSNTSSVAKNIDNIIDMAASIIRDEIRKEVYECTIYPDMNNLSGAKSMVPKSLHRLLHGIIAGRADANEPKERRSTAIAHSIIKSCRPRSFVSPVLLSIGTYIHRKYASRELIDILSSLSFCDNYREVQRLTAAFLVEEGPSYHLGNFTQFIFDNADINVSTLTGHDTFHAMGGIACVTPPTEIPQPKLMRQKNIPSIEFAGKFGYIELKHYRKPTAPGLKSVTISPLVYVDQSELIGLASGKILDVLWQYSFTLGHQPSNVPSWSGFMQVVGGTHAPDQSRIVILPFVNHDPSDPSTIYTSLTFAQKLSDQYNLGVCPVTFDQPLYVKAAEIVASSPDIKSICVRLGGFHTLMSYMGSIGYVMAGSGLEALWETVYAPNTVVHMLSGHAYARALRAHLLSSAAIVSLVVNTPGCMSGIDVEHLNETFKGLLTGNASAEDVGDELEQASHSILNQLKELSQQSRTGRLWMNYYQYVGIIQQFLRAERTGNWKLHIQTVREMIPLFHAAGHLAYAKSARLYVQEMDNLENKMSADQYQKFTEKGYFSIHRTEHSWGGNFSDQTIEQDLMRLLKTAGGMSHGRGITDSSLSKWVHSLPYCIPICDALETFTGVHTLASEQHKDLRISSTIKDSRDCNIFANWLADHSPFQYTENGALISISSGLVADEKVNCDEADVIGTSAAKSLEGKSFVDLKLSRKDRVYTISGVTNTVKVRGQEAVVNPTLLLMRITCVIKDAKDMEEHLCYELAQQPPSLFDKGNMRISNKHVLGTYLKSKVTAIQVIPEPAHFVIDGGHLLHIIIWPKDATYQQVLDTYVSSVKNHYGLGSYVVFDGYTDRMTTKDAERQRRASHLASSEILFERSMKVTTPQKPFLQNTKNKSRFIKFLMEDLARNGIKVEQHVGDADSLIVSTALLLQNQAKPVIVVGTDTDILVMLISIAPHNANIYMLCSVNPIQLFNIQELQSTHVSIRHHLLFAHAITGSDTTSSMYMKGKIKCLDILSSQDDADYLDAFTSPYSTNEEIAHAGQKFLLRLYGASPRVKSLDEQRFIQYSRSVSKASISTVFKLEVLPPTTAAAKFHCYRAYHTVQMWLGNQLDPTGWGWRINSTGMLIPIETDKPVAPDNVLKMISCGCKSGCGRSCGCRKAGLKCSVMCSQCYGFMCSNINVDNDI